MVALKVTLIRGSTSAAFDFGLKHRGLIASAAALQQMFEETRGVGLSGSQLHYRVSAG